MLEEVVHAILPLNLARAVRFKKRPYENRAYIRKRRAGRTTSKQHTEDALTQLDKSMDNAETYTIKRKALRKLKVSMLLSFLVFYVCLINVIIKCDVSDVNIKKFKEKNGPYRVHEYIRDKRLWQGLKYGDRINEKSIREGRVSTKRETTDGDKLYKYTGPEYYDEYKKEDLVNNVTENSHSVSFPNYAFDNSRAVDYPHDLTENPFYIKKVNSNLRPRFNWFKEKTVKLGVLLPFDPNHVFSLVKVLPILEMAVPAVTKPDGPLPGWKILVDHRDTECSSTHGPLAAFEFYVNGSADAFIGPGCEYVIAPVARYAGVWGIPVLTAGAQAEAFFHKKQYQSLTRMMGSYTQAGDAIRKVLEEFNWNRISMMYHNNDPASGKGNSLCYMTLSAMFTVLRKKSHISVPNYVFDETSNSTTYPNFKKLLKKVALSSRSK